MKIISSKTFKFKFPLGIYYVAYTFIDIFSSRENNRIALRNETIK